MTYTKIRALKENWHTTNVVFPICTPPLTQQNQQECDNYKTDGHAKQ
jgi:hypothetical protein